MSDKREVLILKKIQRKILAGSIIIENIRDTIINIFN